MAATTYTVYNSDLTGKKIEKDTERAQLRVLDHPSLNEPVVLDAYVLEVAGLEHSTLQFVTVEVILPDDSAPKRLMLELDSFNKLFKAGADVDEVLSKADSYATGQSSSTPKRRGRPAGSSNKTAASKASGSGMGKEQLQAVREWLRSQGHEVSDRGRVKVELMALFESAHAS